MGKIILITGGARSGKSAYAERRAAELGGEAVTYVATAEALDEEMARRIARHRAERPSPWTTVECPRGAAGALRSATTRVVLLDCLTVLASNALLAAEAEGEETAQAAVLEEAERLREAGIARGGTTLVVTNEVGLGVRPSESARFLVIASPAGNYFSGPLRPVSLWLSQEYVRAAPGGTGAAKTGGNYAASLVAQQEATENGCDQVV
ncbi:MAG: bifunctional adenosylcobinamide kinase/adenosylcobinamide-phosphate guanylyltransferase, partial [Gemmatimonadetes bacterium]|nr:bifunctional adenosylcobinamide kinase/adenosylcobinamide-phosphate guanylyltransferase [Gemmatimonadota bacterium]